MNGNNTRYSSSSLLKNAQIWRVWPSCDPAKEMGAEICLIAVPYRNASAVARHADSQKRMSRSASACPLYFGIGSAGLDDNNIHPPTATKVWSIPSSNCLVSTPLV